jgi:hypothetical protein
LCRRFQKVYRVAKQVKPKKVYNMTCPCGLGRIGEVRNTSTSAQPKIVNGYVPETRPWMVYIQV